MSGEQKFLTLIVCIVIICITILYCFLFISLWAYKEVVGGSLLFFLAIFLAVVIRGKLNEQALRRERYRHHEEIPLDFQGEPRYWPEGAQENPYRSFDCYQTQEQIH